MRIQGLVRVFNHVKGKLQTGLSPGEVDQFRNRVRAVVRDVEEICRRHGASPDSLPAPSRLAYRFLKDLDLQNLPIRQDSNIAPVKSGFKIRNVVKIGDYFIQKFWRQHARYLQSAEERQALESEIQSQVDGIERICGEHDATPADLEGPSRQTFSWLKLLSNQDNLIRHLESLSTAADVIAVTSARTKTPIEVQLINMKAIWQAKQYSNIFILKANQGFMCADRQVWQAIVQNALSREGSTSKQVIHEYAASEDFNEVLIEMDSFVATTSGNGGGHIHNLDESFDRVNAAYFNGLMEKPVLVWNRTPTLRKFGHYQPGRDTVMISVSLDAPGIPAFVVDFVLYHELLHKKHGATMVNGRRLAHSPAFRADERLFAEYRIAHDLIRELALRHRGL